jgi:alkylation response protein AidB-like acyl-CoA dehydrogenase
MFDFRRSVSNVPGKRLLIVTLCSAMERQRFFPEIAKGRTMTAVAITEPQSGSDVGSMKTRAVKNGNSDYILNGEKCFITFSPVADYILVFARVGDISGGTRNISAFTVDAKAPGVSIGKNEKKLGLKGIPNAPSIWTTSRSRSRTGWARRATVSRYRCASST